MHTEFPDLMKWYLENKSRYSSKRNNWGRNYLRQYFCMICNPPSDGPITLVDIENLRNYLKDPNSYHDTCIVGVVYRVWKEMPRYPDAVRKEHENILNLVVEKITSSPITCS